MAAWGNFSTGEELALGNQRENLMADDEKTAPAAQEAQAAKAMELKNAAPAPHHPAPERTASEGMNDTPNTKIAPSGAFDAEGQRPVLERSRKAR